MMELDGMIEAYTGLSPMAFFTILTLMVGVYRFVCGMFVDTTPPRPEALEAESPVLKKPTPPAAAAEELSFSKGGEEKVTEEQLTAYDGSDPNKPLLMAIKGQIYDVSTSRMFYGPGGPYALFAGRDASRALALMSFDPNDLTGNIDGLNESELDVLQDWEYKFQEKYPKVGKIVTGRAGDDDDTASAERRDGNPEEATRNITMK